MSKIQSALLDMNILLSEKQTLPKQGDNPKVVRGLAFNNFSSVYKAE